jgi:transposase
MKKAVPWAYPAEVRSAAVNAYLNGLGTQDEVCAAFECSRSSLGRWLRSHVAGKSLAPSSVRGKALPKVNGDKLAVLKSLVEKHADQTYEALTELYNAATNDRVSRSTVMRAIWALGFTWKKKRFELKKPTPRGSSAFEQRTRVGSRPRTSSVSSSSTNRGATWP